MMLRVFMVLIGTICLFPDLPNASFKKASETACTVEIYNNQTGIKVMSKRIKCSPGKTISVYPLGSLELSRTVNPYTMTAYIEDYGQCSTELDVDRFHCIASDTVSIFIYVDNVQIHLL